MIRRGPRSAVLAVLLSLALPTLATAQTEDSGFDLRIRGLLDLVAAPNNDAVALNLLNAGGSAFDPYRGRLFVEGTATKNLDIYTQLHLSEESGVLIYGAYATWRPIDERDLNLQAGKIPWPIGTWAPRTYSNKNPLVGTPLLYQYHTTLRGEVLPPDIDALLSEAGQGQYGVDYLPGSDGWRGMPVIYDFCWDFGAVFLGSARPFEFSVAVTNGTPSSSNAGRDWNQDKSIMGRLGLTPTAGLRLGISGSTGAYLPDDVEAVLPPGTSVEGYDQNLLMADLEYAIGRFEFFAEAALNTWETPTVGDLTVRGGYVEGKYAFDNGAFVAARYDALLFDEVQGTTGPARPWDDDVRRFEGGIGFRFDRHVIAKAIYQTTTLDPGPAGDSRSSDLVAAQVSLGF